VKVPDGGPKEARRLYVGKVGRGVGGYRYVGKRRTAGQPPKIRKTPVPPQYKGQILCGRKKGKRESTDKLALIAITGPKKKKRV